MIIGLTGKPFSVIAFPSYMTIALDIDALLQCIPPAKLLFIPVDKHAIANRSLLLSTEYNCGTALDRQADLYFKVRAESHQSTLSAKQINHGSIKCRKQNVHVCFVAQSRPSTPSNPAVRSNARRYSTGIAVTLFNDEQDSSYVSLLVAKPLLQLFVPYFTSRSRFVPAMMCEMQVYYSSTSQNTQSPCVYYRTSQTRVDACVACMFTNNGTFHGHAGA